MDEVEMKMGGLAIDESSLYDDHESYVDLEYEFDAFKFFDFSIDETDYEIQEAESWFRYNAPEYPPAPYMVKINLTNVLKSTPTQVYTARSLKLEAVSPSNCDISSSEEKTEGVEYHNLIADVQIMKAKFNSTNRSSKDSKPSKTFMKPTASHLAKQINVADIRGSCYGRSPKLQTPNSSETEDTKRQKLEIGFLRKVSHLKHQTLFTHKTTTKVTVAQTPKLMTEEREGVGNHWSQNKAEANVYTFKALPLNRKIFASPNSFPIRKKYMSHLPEFQKFHFTYDN